MPKSKSKKAKPKINLYRNISVTFIVFTALLLAAVILLFSNKATIFITPKPQEISINFNLQIKENPTAAELTEKDLVAGKMETFVKSGSRMFETLSTKTVDSEIVGNVRIINQSARDQTLVKTTQLQAVDGAIVRTNDSVMVPAGGEVAVAVFAKDPATFTEVAPGNLTIIKLNPSLQDKIYAVADRVLTDSPREVRVVSESDLNRAKDELSDQIIAEFKKDGVISDQEEFVSNIKNFKTDKNVGDEADSFNLEAEVEIKALKLNEGQLAALLAKKVANLDLSGLQIGQLDVKNVKYEIINDNFDGGILLKVDYTVIAGLNYDNPSLNRLNFLGKSEQEAEDYLSSQALIQDSQILISPYWRHRLPKQESKINVIIK